jgi:hypothetical protein
MTTALTHPYRPQPLAVPLPSRWTQFKRWFALRFPDTWKCHRKAVGGHWEYIMGAYLGDGMIPLPGWVRVRRCTHQVGGVKFMAMTFTAEICENWPEVPPGA